MPGRRANVHVFYIVDGNYNLEYIQRSFKQRASIGTGTVSGADWACQGDEKNVHFFSDSRRVATGLGRSRETLSKEIPWAQARLQMQIGHARATRRTFIFFSDSRGGATGLGTSRETLSNEIPWAQARLQVQIGHARATRRAFIFFR